MNDKNSNAGDSAYLDEMMSSQQRFYHTGATRSVRFRKEQLLLLQQAVQRLEPEMMDALRQDLNKSEQEAYSTEIGIILNEIRVALRNVRRWSKPKRVRTPLTHIGGSSRIVPEPLGTTLIMGPWNYPLQLMLVPVVSAIAAGNTMVLKPSELAPATSGLLARLIRETFPPEYATVVEGGLETSTELLKRPFDHIFFTGSPAVGRVVMAAAAKSLIPVTLELGGKSPCIVHKDANIELAARRIVFGKWTNAGQTCVAPDYLLVHKEVKTALLNKMSEVIEEFYGREPLQDPDYGKIVNGRHFRRLLDLLDDDVRIVHGGQSDELAGKLAPTILDGVTLESKAMQGEIFGPILPVIVYEGTEEILNTVRAHPKPLALYLFSGSREFQQRIIERIPFGGGCVNDTILHLANPYLPFGGVGTSGIGSYHGEFGFQAFSHYKSILKQSDRFDLPFRYPKSKWGLRMIRKLLR